MDEFFDQNKPVSNFHYFFDSVCNKTWNTAVNSSNPYYYVAGFVLGIYFAEKNQPYISTDILEGAPDNLLEFIERMRFVADAITNKSTLQILINNSSRLNINFHTALVTITKNDFYALHKLNSDEGSWSLEKHYKTVNYYLILSLLIWKHHATQALTISRFIKIWNS